MAFHWGYAQEPSPTPPPRPVHLPQPFAPNVSDTETLAEETTEPNVFSPWYDVQGNTMLPPSFDPTEAAAAALESAAEAAANTETGFSAPNLNAPLLDLPIEDPEGSLLAAPPEGTQFAADALLFQGGSRGYPNFAKETALSYGEFNYPLSSIPRNIPVFLRPRRLTNVGPLRVSLDVAASAAHVSNVFGESENPKSDQIYNLFPSLYIEAGTRGTLRFLWAPLLTRYSRYKELDTTSQSLGLQVKYPFTKLKVQSDLYYFSQRGLFLTSNGYAEQKNFLARVFGEYPLGRKTTAELGLQSIWQESDPGGSQNDTSAFGRISYRFTPALQVGGSLSAGRVQAPADTQTYAATQLNASCRVGTGLAFSAEGGLEFREMALSGRDRQMLALSIFNLRAAWNPSSSTVLDLRLYRETLNTTFNDVSLSITTGVSAGLVIQFFRRLNLRLEMGAGFIEQFSDAAEQDNHFYFTQGGLTLSYPIVRWMELQVFCNVQQRLASEIGDDYVSAMSGLALTLKF